MEATKSVHLSSEAVSEIFCEPCGKSKDQNRKTNVAEWFCVDCSEYLCGQCCNNHRSFKQFENHVVQGKDHMPWDPKQVKSKDICISKCRSHIDKVIEYVCLTCDEIGCTVCITKDHRKCDSVEYIPDKVKISDPEEVVSFATKLDDMGKNLQELHDNIEENFKVTVKMNKSAKADLDQQKNKIFTSFESLYGQIKMKIQEKQNMDATVFNGCLRKINVLQSDLNEEKARLNTLEQSRQPCEIYIFMKEKENALKKLSSDIKKLAENGKKSEIRYEPSLEVEEIMEDEIKDLGRLIIGEVNQKPHIKVESKRKSMEKEINALRHQTEDLKGKLQKMQALNGGLEQNKIQLKALVTKLEQGNVDLNTKSASLKLDYDKREDKLNKELREHKAEKTKLIEKIHKHEAGQAELNEKICKLEAEGREQCKREDELMEEKTKLIKIIRNQEAEETKLKKEIRELETEQCEQCRRERLTNKWIGKRIWKTFSDN